MKNAILIFLFISLFMRALSSQYKFPLKEKEIPVGSGFTATTADLTSAFGPKYKGERGVVILSDHYFSIYWKLKCSRLALQSYPIV